GWDGARWGGRGEGEGGGGGCPCCVERQFAFLAGDVGVDTTVLCGRNAVQVTPPLELLSGRLDLPALGKRLGSHGTFEVTPMLLRGRLNGGDLELTVFPDGRGIALGTRCLA